MIITTPVTDYIPASLLTANGEIISRFTNNVVRYNLGNKGNIIVSQSPTSNLTNRSIIDALGTYFKGQGAGNYSIFEALALRDTGIHIGNDTRAAAGDQVITGVGFQPSVVIFSAADDVVGNQNWSIGFDDGTIHMILYCYENDTKVSVDVNESIGIVRDGGNFIMGLISAIGGDGFTITWSLTGVCTTDFIYLCLP